MSPETNLPVPALHALSAMAQQRQQAMLPFLLAAVRQRRRRRQLVRAATLVLLLGAVLGLLRTTRDDLAVEPEQPVAVPSWMLFGDDPTVLARCEVAGTVRAEWFVDDDGLQHLLAADGREAGLVRARGQVRVSRTAIDRWDIEAP